MDDMRTMRIYHKPCFLREREGLPADRFCVQVNESIKATRAFARICTHLHVFARTNARTQILITYFVIRTACSIAKETNDAPMKLLGSKTHNEILNRGIRKLQSRHCNPNRVAIAS